MAKRKRNFLLYIFHKTEFSRHCRRLFLFFFIITFFVVDISSYRSYGKVQPIEEMESKLEGISDVEKKVLEELFTLSQNIADMERKSIQINQQLDNLHQEIENLEGMVEDKQKAYDNQLEVLQKLLVNYQRNGPATYLENLLNAKSLTAFLRSLNIIKDISRNTSELLVTLEEGKLQLEAEKDNLSEREKEVEKTRKEYQSALEKMVALKAEQEKILSSLAEQRQAFEGELNYIENMWGEIKVLFSNIMFYFNNIIVSGNLTVDMLNLKFEFPKIRGSLNEQALNDILSKQKELPEMYFHFHEDYINVEVPEKRFALKCHFEIEEKQSIKFVVDEGTFYGMPLTESSISELLKDGTLVINFKDILGFITVESAKTFEGYMEFVIVPAFN